MSSVCKATSRERLSRRKLWRAAEKFGCHSGPGGPSERIPETQAKALFLKPVFMGSGFCRCAPARSDGDLGLFQRTALAVSAAPTMSKAATAGVSEACAVPDAAAEIMREAATHAMSEAVAEIAVRTRIIRSVAPIVG